VSLNSGIFAGLENGETLKVAEFGLITDIMHLIEQNVVELNELKLKYVVKLTIFCFCLLELLFEAEMEFFILMKLMYRKNSILICTFV